MALEYNESCGSRAVDSSSSSLKQNRQDRQRLKVFNKVLTQLQHLNHQDANLPGGGVGRGKRGYRRMRGESGPKERGERSRCEKRIANRWGGRRGR
ncbi:Serine/threonine-protein kinase STY17 [Camellia lanceoleosa]|uniref:Serine/threonine-protein kinase STY17 n=1 Tax=Camellia lanceoleosa TaxID=1840588 RepID=A0ACC0HLZ9_9ERIC|nr:Serine/threonine-protein kinase STY17 [Camellia lanceoleosa]